MITTLRGTRGFYIVFYNKKDKQEIPIRDSIYSDIELRKNKIEYKMSGRVSYAQTIKESSSEFLKIDI